MYCSFQLQKLLRDVCSLAAGNRARWAFTIDQGLKNKGIARVAEQAVALAPALVELTLGLNPPNCLNWLVSLICVARFCKLNVDEQLKR